MVPSAMRSTTRWSRSRSSRRLRQVSRQPSSATRSRPEFRRWWAFGGLCRGVVAGRGLVVCHGSQFGVGTRCVACRSTSQQVECLGVGVYLREARRRNRDGTTVSYLQLAHNQRHPVTGASTAKVIHSFGRAETVDRAGLARLVASISRFLDPQQAVAAAAGAEVEVVDSRRLGAAWVLDRLWERLGIGAAVRRVAEHRKLDGELAERVVFALVAQRALEPGSKLAGCAAPPVACSAWMPPPPSGRPTWTASGCYGPPT